METLIVIAIVVSAAIFFGINLFKKVRVMRSSKKPSCSECSGCAGKCLPCGQKDFSNPPTLVTSEDVPSDAKTSNENTSKKRVFRPIAVATLTLGVLVSSPASAADTVEVYAPGEVSFETHVGMEGFRDGRKSLMVGNESLIGIGITKYVSGFVGFSFESNGYLAENAGSFSFGLISTVLDLDHFDIDLMLTFDGGIAPGLELNLDMLKNFGIYLRAEVPIVGTPDFVTSDDYEVTVMLALTPGLYWAVSDGHQLFLEASTEFFWSHQEDAGGRVEVWSAALGYNVMFLDNLELVTEVKLFQPRNEEVEFGFGLGIIASLP